ncbi:MAG TPA: hypothetical protein GX525_03905 [Bacilli bacterium]|nr:hypothetical protein [Bacilli bacterium]
MDLNEFLSLDADKFKQWEVKARYANNVKREEALWHLYKMFPLSDSSKKRERICIDTKYIQEEAYEACMQNSYD